MLENGRILKNELIAKDTYEMVLSAPGISQLSKPGQFVNLRLTKKLDPLLRRPISLHNIDQENGTITMLYVVVGQGTTMMSQMETGEFIDVLGPLGNGWNCSFSGNHAVLVGGGIGVAPLYPLAEELVKQGKHVELIMGAKSKDYLTDSTPYDKLDVKVTITTDDGSTGIKGFVTDALQESINSGTCDFIYACGPKPMLKAVEKTAQGFGVPGQVSTESHMGCGLGVCLLCPVKVKSGGYKRTCTDGPVFDLGVLDYE